MNMKDIAKKAGVSVSAVSMVLNNKSGVSDKTRQRVLDTMDEAGYIPRKSKAKVRNKVIALVKYSAHGMIIEENQGFIASIIDQIEAECRQYSYRVTMFTCNRNSFLDSFKTIESGKYDGIIIIGTEMDVPQIEYLRTIRIPMVIVDNAMVHESFDSVVMDNEGIAYNAVAFLSSLGYTKIGYLKSSVSISNFVQRANGYNNAIEKLGLSKDIQVQLTPTLNGAYADMKEFLSANKKLPHAMFADNDTIAIGAMKALNEKGYSIPQDISIIGVDDIAFSAIASPSLTTMRVSRTMMGILAVDALRRKLLCETDVNVRSVVIGELIERHSTCRAKSTDI